MFVQDRLQEDVEEEKGKESTWIRANLQKKNPYLCDYCDGEL